jgi:hypothetical protein
VGLGIRLKARAHGLKKVLQKQMHFLVGERDKHRDEEKFQNEYEK